MDDTLLTGSRRVIQRLGCGLLASTAIVAIIGILGGSTEVPVAVGEVHCGKGDFPIFCGSDEALVAHPVLSTSAGRLALILSVAVLVFALLGTRGLRRAMVAGIVAMVVAPVAGIALADDMFGEFMAFRGSDGCVFALLALVAMFFAGGLVVIGTVLTERAEHKRANASIPEARVLR